MKSYEKYKPSGVEWIGDIPEGWEVKKLKHITKLYPICNTSNLEEDSIITYSPMECVKNGYLVKDSKEFYNANNSYNFFMNGDILLAKVTPCFENGNIAIAENLVNGVGFGSSELFILRCKNINNRYMFYYYQTTVFRQMAISTMYGAGGLKRISVGFMKENKLAVPPLAIQSAIVNYLDSRLYTIGSIIKTKEKLIDLLKEKRTSIISHAVTKGLDPNAKMKPSGVEWIGDIPEDWEVKRLKYIAKSPLMYGANESPIPFDEQEPRYIRITDIDDNGNLKENTAVSLELEKARPYLLRKNDILFARSGATVGKSYIFEVDDMVACFAGYLIRLKTNIRIALPKFIRYITYSKMYLMWIESNTIQATIQNVSAEKYRNLCVALPNKSTQAVIVSYLDRETAQIDAAIEKTKQSIEKLKEYRTTLISACVTGKIDVREG